MIYKTQHRKLKAEQDEPQYEVCKIENFHISDFTFYDTLGFLQFL
jgi:hypothetical protein